MKVLCAVIIAFAAGFACSGNSPPGHAQEGAETLHIGSQTVPLLRSDVPIDVVAQQFKLADARAMSNGITQLVTMRGRSDVSALVERCLAFGSAGSSRLQLDGHRDPDRQGASDRQCPWAVVSGQDGVPLLRDEPTR